MNIPLGEGEGAYSEHVSQQLHEDEGHGPPARVTPVSKGRGAVGMAFTGEGIIIMELCCSGKTFLLLQGSVQLVGTGPRSSLQNPCRLSFQLARWSG